MLNEKFSHNDGGHLEYLKVYGDKLLFRWTRKKHMALIDEQKNLMRQLTLPMVKSEYSGKLAYYPGCINGVGLQGAGSSVAPARWI